MEIYYFEFFALFALIGLVLPGRIVPTFAETLRLDVPSRGATLSTGLLLFLVMIGVVAGSRDISLGSDYHNYYEFYQYIYQTGGFSVSFWIDSEPGWAYLNYGFAVLGVTPGFFFGMVTSVTYLIMSLACTTFRQLLPLIFFFLFSIGTFYWSLSGLRQSVAIAIFFLAVRFIVDRKPVSYLAALLVGATFHNSILVMGPAYLLNRLPYFPQPSVAMVAASLALAGLLDITVLTDVFTHALGIFEQFSKYEYYMKREEFVVARTEGGTYLGFWLKGLFSVWVAWRAGKIVEQRKDFAVYANLFVICSVLTHLFLSVELMGRLIAYPSVGLPVMAAATIYTSSKKDEKVLSHVFLVAFVLLFLASTHSFISGSASPSKALP